MLLIAVFYVGPILLLVRLVACVLIAFLRDSKRRQRTAMDAVTERCDD